MDSGVFTSWCPDAGGGEEEEEEGREQGGERGDRERVASAPSSGWDTVEIWLRPGGGEVLGWLERLGSARFRALLWLRLQHAGQRPRRCRLIKGSAPGHVVWPRPIDVNVHSWGSGAGVARREGGS